MPIPLRLEYVIDQLSPSQADTARPDGSIALKKRGGFVWGRPATGTLEADRATCSEEAGARS